MKCFWCFSFALFVLLGVFFGSFIINQNNTYAVSDTVLTYSSSYLISNSSIDISCSNKPCYDYNYIHMEVSGTTTSTFNQAIGLKFSGAYFNWFYVGRQSSQWITLNSGFIYTSMTLNPFQLDSSNNFTLTITFTDTSPFSSTPSGSIELTENGTYDVSQYAEAVVNVPETDCPPSSGGDYHNDLVAINNSIMICAATCLVIYFFYCIYRMIIKNSGVK